MDLEKSVSDYENIKTLDDVKKIFLPFVVDKVLPKKMTKLINMETFQPMIGYEFESGKYRVTLELLIDFRNFLKEIGLWDIPSIQKYINGEDDFIKDNPVLKE